MAALLNKGRAAFYALPMAINTIIFDLGAVLIDWHPHHLYNKIFTEPAQRDWFLENICTNDWNEEQDGGRALAEGTELRVKQFPEHEENIRVFYGRWVEMLNGPIDGTPEIFRQLKESGKYKIYALSNWSAETMEIAFSQFEFLDWFDGMVISGLEKMRKPEPVFYQLLLDRYSIKPEEALFIDDNKRNIIAAEKMGINSIHFINAAQLEKELKSLDIL
ncbi:HAD family hydrolase [Mucilaginibacter terrae]|uniref:2-haloacid dehalogenase n=1 Tax=Mucilaginibacter terrae TaxID=1955052 RepID=A0ABU3GWJ0_9SPHI|nr:HAD family phosphatase [Mucilaginibacter terrae]MDT3404133.1 2-haloacid dehalogenase [Mucilaginibacter terrae]